MGAVMKLGDKGMENVPIISTGPISLEKALGVSGIPGGFCI